MWLIVLLFAASVCLGGYHVAVEQHWIAGPTACTGGLGGATSPDELLKMLQARQPVQCDVVQWSLFGISLAGLNLIASLLLFVFSFVAARRGDAS
jgi:disulfide bond formation protein DsbB